MSLIDRLQKKTPCGYSQRFFFEIKGNGYFDKGALILLVAERFSSLYGALTEINANRLYERLSKRYCTGAGWRPCYRSLEIESDMGRGGTYKNELRSRT